MKFSESAKIRLQLLLVLLIGGIIFGLLFWLFSKLRWWAMLVIVIYMACYAFVGWLSEHSKLKVMKVISIVISAPVVVVFLIVDLIKPFITIIGTFFFVAVFGLGVLIWLLKGLDVVFKLELLPETFCFIAIAVCSILFANSYWLTKKIIRWSPLGNREEHEYESYREKLAFYLIQPCNVVFLLYLVYFVLLAIIGFMQIQYGRSLFTEGYDAAIIKAFLVFIAFTNMKAKARNSDLDPREILKQTLRLYVHDDEEWIRRRFKSEKES